MCRPDSRRCARDGALRSPTMRVLLRHAADDPAQHAVPGDGVPDGLPAPARGAARPRGDAGRRRRSSCSCACSAAPAWSGCRDELRARASDARSASDAAVDRALPRARATLRRDGRRRSCASSRAAIRASRCASSAARSCPRARASPRSSHGRCAHDEDDPLAWAFGALGIARSREAPREPLHRRPRRRAPRRHRPALRALALRRAARRERARRSIRCATRSRASRRSSTTMLDELTARARRARTGPTSSG